MARHIPTVLTLLALGSCSALAQPDRAEERIVDIPESMGNSFRAHFGAAVAQGEGITAVGAEGDWSVYLYGEQLNTVVSSFTLVPGRDLEFGSSLDIHGNILFVGAPVTEDIPSSRHDPARVVLLDISNPTNPVELGQCTRENAADRFGRSFGVSNGLLAVGDVFECSVCPTSGEVALFDVSDPTNPVEINAVRPSAAPDLSPLFGFSVAMQDNLLFVGSLRRNRVHIFDISDPINPVELDTVVSPVAGDTYFGFSIAVDGTTLIVGAPRDGQNAFRNGAAHAFDVSDPADTAFMHTFRPTEPFTDSLQLFGSGVGVEGDTAVVSGCSFAEVFDLTTGESLGRLLPSAVGDCDLSVNSPLITDTSIYLGAPFQNAASVESGAVYVFARFTEGCTAADVAPPLGTLNTADINAYVAAYLASDPIADLDGDGSFNTTDINLFVSSFVNGCG